MATDLISLAGLGELGILRIESDVVGTSTFYGFSKNLTTATSQPNWLIARETVAGDETELIWASSLFDQIWDDRESLFANPPFADDNSILFRNSNQQLQFPNYVNALDYTGLSPFSASFWIRTSKTGEQAIISKQASTNGAGWRVTMQANQTRLHFSSGGAGTRMELRSPTLSLADDNWHHIGWSISDAVAPVAGKYTLVVDGVDQTASVTVNNDSFTTSAVSSAIAKIGVRDANALDTDGFLNELSMYTVQLSVSEFQSIYNLGGSGKPGDLINNGPQASSMPLWGRMGDNDTHPNYTNLGTAGTELDMLHVNGKPSDITGEVP